MLVIVTNGPPGAGKSTLLEELVECYEGTYIDRDMYNRDFVKFFEGLESLVKKGEPFLFIGMQVPNEKYYKDLLTHLPGYDVIYLNFDHKPDDIVVYLERVLTRKDSGSSIDPLTDKMRELEVVDIDASQKLREEVTEIVMSNSAAVEDFMEGVRIPVAPLVSNIRRVKNAIDEYLASVLRKVYPMFRDERTKIYVLHKAMKAVIKILEKKRKINDDYLVPGKYTFVGVKYTSMGRNEIPYDVEVKGKTFLAEFKSEFMKNFVEVIKQDDKVIFEVDWKDFEPY